MLLNSSVEVFDDLLSPALASELISAISWMPMYFLNRWKEFKSHELDMHWYYPIAFSDAPYTEDVEPKLDHLDGSLQSITQCWHAIKASHGDRPVRLYECMLSANTFGTEGRVHRDIAEDKVRDSHHIALVYCNSQWKPDWAGETLVFDEEGEIVAAVMPKPGRIVKIHGDPTHVGRSVSRICPTDRRVLVFKYWLPSG